ncbi:MAG: DUF2059 domain-containing protein [Sulfurovum sp.]|nr:DUF2059 domain-containing protein [Sulfurovum sp.]
MFKSSTKSLLLIASLALPCSVYANAEASPKLGLAEELLTTMHIDKNYAKMIDKITLMQLRKNPKLKVVEGTIHEFFEKYMGWDVLKVEMATLYNKNYTSKELEDIIAFYKTEVGQKTLKLMPQIVLSGTQLAQKKLLEHTAELKSMIESELKVLAETK